MITRAATVLIMILLTAICTNMQRKYLGGVGSLIKGPARHSKLHTPHLAIYPVGSMTISHPYMSPCPPDHPGSEAEKKKFPPGIQSTIRFSCCSQWFLLSPTHRTDISNIHSATLGSTKCLRSEIHFTSIKNGLVSSRPCGHPSARRLVSHVAVMSSPHWVIQPCVQNDKPPVT